MQKEVNYYIIPNNQDLSIYKNTSFILPLENYSVGFENYFSIEEINNLTKKYDISIIINKFLHKEELNNIKKYLLKLENIKYFFIEDLSLTSFLEKEKIVLFPNHIISNYEAINYLKELGFENCLISNELTVDEIKEILGKTSSNLFYLYLNMNQIMYSKRNLLTNFYKNYNIKNGEKTLELYETSSHHHLKAYEENKSTIIYEGSIFCASKYISEFNNINLIYNFTGISEANKKIILDNMFSKELCNLINANYEFLENKIIYKVGGNNE